MTSSISTAPIRFTLHGVMLTAMAALLLALGPGRAVAADPGVVEVYGYQWSKPYQVQLSSLQGTAATVDGEQVTTYGLREILNKAQSQQSPAGIDFAVSTLSKIEIVFPANKGKVTYSGEQIRANDGSLASFYVNSENVTVMRVPGRSGSVAQYEYTTLNPQLYQPKQAQKSFTVSVAPRQKTVKSGTSVKFTATVQGLGSGVNPSFVWSINGATQGSSGRTLTGTFTGKSGRSFVVTVSVSASGYNSSTGGAQVFIEKAPKKKKKQKNDETPGGNDVGDDGYIDDNYYVPGYTDYGDGGGGTYPGYDGSGDPAPSATPEKKKPPVDDGMETVTGQLIDPDQIATVIPPSDTATTGSGEEAATSGEDSGGGGVPTGVKTAIGIGALLGLGGLAEAGAFAGRLRRFRP